MSQIDTLKAHLEAGNSITPLQALELCGSLRLSERIRELEREGMLIDHEMVKLPSGKRVCRYSKLRVAYG